MKAIYLNLDPYLQTVADWLNAGKPGTAPSFDPLPVAVTIPLGESAAIFLVADCSAVGYEIEPQTVTVDGQEISVAPGGYDEGLPDGTIAFNQTPGFSALAPSLKYAVIPVSGSSTSVSIKWTDGVIEWESITIPVLVRREQASGPVDLVDFTPPLSAADIKSALVAAGDTALEGVSIGGTVLPYGTFIGCGMEDGETIQVPFNSVGSDELITGGLVNVSGSSI